MKGIGLAIGLSVPGMLVGAVGVMAAMYLLGRFLPPVISERAGNKVLGFINKTKQTIKEVATDANNGIRRIARTKVGGILLPIPIR